MSRITFVVTALVLGIGATILAGFVTQTAPAGYNANNQSTWSVAQNVTNNGLVSINTMASYLPTVALVAVAAVVVGVILLYFAKRN